MRVEHEYERTGALALLAALDVHTGQVFASTPPTTGTAPFTALVDQVVSQEPYRGVDRVFVVVDNGSDHRGKAAIKRLRDPPPELHHDPHSGARVVAEPGGGLLLDHPAESGLTQRLASTGQLADTLQAFIARYNATAAPFKWKYTAADLDRHLARLPAQAPTATASEPLPEAA